MEYKGTLLSHTEAKVIYSTGTLCSWNSIRNSSRNNSLWPIQLGHTLLSLLRFCSPMGRTQHICSTAKYKGGQDIKSSGKTTFNVFPFESCNMLSRQKL